MRALGRVGFASLLLVAACAREEPEFTANITLDDPAPARPALPPEAAAPVDVGRDDVALERSMVPELSGIAPTPGTWQAVAGRATFSGPGGVQLSIACEGDDIVLAHRPPRPPAGESALTILTERGTNRFEATAAGPMLTARFTAQLPFFRDALTSGEGVIGLSVGERRPVVIANDEAVADAIENCR